MTLERSYPLEARRWFTDAEWNEMADLVLWPGVIEYAFQGAFATQRRRDLISLKEAHPL